jgi:hypothetical protein
MAPKATRDQRRHPWTALIAAALLILALLINQPLHASGRGGGSHASSLVKTGNIKSAQPLPADAKVVKFGLQILDIDDLDVSGMTFQANGWYWLKWDQSVQDLLDREKVLPKDLVKPLNLISPWYSKFEYDDATLKRLDSGEYYFIVKFSGVFFFNDLDQDRAPFLTLWAPVDFEIDDFAFALGRSSELRLVPDEYIQSPDQILGGFSDLNGFTLASAGFNGYIHEYPGGFGESQGASAFSGVQLDLIYDISFWTAFVEFLLPPALVFVLTVLSPFIDPRETDIRLGVPSTSILSLVFLQSFTNDRFPPTPTLSYMDQLFAYLYLSAAAVFVLFIWTTNTLNRFTEQGDGQLALRQIRRTERIVQVSCVCGLLLTAVLEWLI